MVYNKILLETGTNELEIVEFKIRGISFGINVAKVKEIIKHKETIRIPNSHSCILGIFKWRDSAVSVIDLPQYLNLTSQKNNDKEFFIVTYFNKIMLAFVVDFVVGIKRLSWKDIEKPDSTIYGGTEGIINGIVKKDHLISILDFEKIISDISPRTSIQVSDISKVGSKDRNNRPILIVDDSQMLSRMIKDCLLEAGYQKLIMASNGKEAWDILKKIKDRKDKKPNKLLSCVITDIEMPQMDGHHLTRCIKEDPVLCTIPVVLFSSLISDDMKRKGEAIGADAQISKPEIINLVSVIDKLIEE